MDLTKYVKIYFSDVNSLIAAICEYKRVPNIRHGEYILYDIIRQPLSN